MPDGKALWDIARERLNTLVRREASRGCGSPSALPMRAISWRGLLSQYAGRLHRLHPSKRDVMIYDYVDAREPMLLSMSMKRRSGYRTLGYTEVSVEETPSRS